MSKGKEKINWKFAIIVSILLSIILSFIITVILISVENSRTRSSNILVEVSKANNEKFTSCFGDNTTTAEIKNIINLIRMNNITAENNNAGLGYIYIVFDGKLCSPTEVSKAVKNGKRYMINHQNDRKISEETFLNSNEFILNNSEAGAGYYYNDFIRAISIYERTEENLEKVNNEREAEEQERKKRKRDENMKNAIKIMMVTITVIPVLSFPINLLIYMFSK